MLDHLIISKKSYYSFKDSGMLAKIIENSRYELDFDKIGKLIASNQNLRINSLKEKLELEGQTMETAKQMVADGLLDITKISKYTGMSIDQVKQLQADQ
jgi:hypothetical protein